MKLRRSLWKKRNWISLGLEQIFLAIINQKTNGDKMRKSKYEKKKDTFRKPLDEEFQESPNVKKSTLKRHSRKIKGLRTYRNHVKRITGKLFS